MNFLPFDYTDILGAILGCVVYAFSRWKRGMPAHRYATIALHASALFALLLSLIYLARLLHIEKAIAYATGSMLALIGNVFGWASLHQGTRVGIETFVVEIGFVCSGISFVVLFIPTMFAVAQVTKATVKHVCAGVILLLALNTFRIIALVLIGAFLSAEAALGIFHSAAGFVIYLIFLLAFNSMLSRSRPKGVSRP